MSDTEQDEYKAYQEDARIPCRYGPKCYQKNPVHHEKYKHPPKETKRQKIIRQIKVDNKKYKKRVTGETSTDPRPKKQKRDDFTDKNIENESISRIADNDNLKNSEENNETNEDSSNSSDAPQVKDSSNKITVASLLEDLGVNTEDDKVLLSDAQTVISHLFLTEMPDDFYEFYEFCKRICEKDPLNAFKDIQLYLAGPYDVFKSTFLSSKVNDKEALLRHWRYYYDPPEFQTIIRSDDKDGLHFGYWRDDLKGKPAFVAKNRANLNCVIEPVAENIFGAFDTYVGDKLKLATPFEKMRLSQLQQKLRNHAKGKNITLDKDASNMKTREKKVIARTFHKAGIVVPYNKETQLGYRDLAVTDKELREVLKQMDEAPLEAKKKPMSRLEEVMRLATIAADECDFGTCLELGHDLFSSGVSAVQNKALSMLSLAYNLLERPQFLLIAKAHLKDRRKGLNLSVLD